MTVRGWEHHESDVQELLGLSPTIASGSKFHDIGDAVDHKHYSESEFRFIADCKYTESKSFSVGLQLLRQWEEKAAELGKRFLLPLRFWPKDARNPRDYAIISLHDLSEMLEALKKPRMTESEKRQWTLDLEHLTDIVSYSKMTPRDRIFLRQLLKNLGAFIDSV